MNRVVHSINLGAGVQSSTMALKAAKGEIQPMPDFAVFADTEDEPFKVYRHLDWLETQLPFPVHRVTNGRLSDVIGKLGPNGKHSKNPIPAFAKSTNGEAFPLNRKCTADYKIAPIERFIRQYLGIANKRSPDHVVIVQWMGISTDEITRMKHSRHKWSQLRYPLIEEGMSRGDCLEWMARNGYPEPPKSACTFCPFHSDSMWREMKLPDPESWNQAVEVDRKIRDIWSRHENGREMFLHRSLKPLEEVDFRNLEDMGQLNMFENECEGMCGV